MRARIAAAALAAVLAASAVHAQFRGARFPMATADSFDGAFQFCRAMFRGIQGGDGGGWSTTIRDADLNFSIRLGELTKTPVSKDKRTGEPNHLVVPLTDPTAVPLPVHHDDRGRRPLHRRRRSRGCCATICARAASCGPTTSGAATPGASGRARSARRCRRASTRSSICRSITRSSTSSSR